LASEILLNLN